MAQDYDTPRSKDEDEESLEALSNSTRQDQASDLDDDENAIAEDYELQVRISAMRTLLLPLSLSRAMNLCALSVSLYITAGSLTIMKTAIPYARSVLHNGR